MNFYSSMLVAHLRNHDQSECLLRIESMLNRSPFMQPGRGGDRDASQAAAGSQGSAGEGSRAHQNGAASDASTPAPRRSG